MSRITDLTWAERSSMPRKLDNEPFDRLERTMSRRPKVNKLERLRKLHNEATEGPWRAGDELVEAAGGLEWEAVAAILKPPYVEYDYVRDAQPAQVDRSTNARLIAEARNALLAVAEAAKNIVPWLEHTDGPYLIELKLALAPMLGESDE